MGNGGIEFALHRKGNRWFVVHPRAYGMAESRWVASLNNPRDSDPPSTVPPASLAHLNHRFWYNSEHLELDHLLKAQQIYNYDNSVRPLLKVTGTSRTEKRRAGHGSEAEVEIEAKQVEVLIGQDQLCRRCIHCGYWEESGCVKRHVKVGQDGDDPSYWCGACNITPAKRLWNSMPSLSFGKKDGNAIDWSYF